MISHHQYLIIGNINGLLSSILIYFHQYLLYSIFNIPFSKYLPYTIPKNSNIIWHPTINISSMVISMVHYLPYLIYFHQYLLYSIFNIPFSKYLPYTIPKNSNIIWYPTVNISSMVISMVISVVYYLPYLIYFHQYLLYPILNFPFSISHFQNISHILYP